jgi:hypothetical protein
MGFPPIELPEDEGDKKARLRRAMEGKDQDDPLRYHHLRTTIAAELVRVAVMSDSGDVQAVSKNFRTIEQSVPRLLGRRWRKLYVAIGFWDCWIAEADRGFPQNVLVGRNEWAPLARTLAADLLADRNVTHPQILAIADLSNSVSLIRTNPRR